VPPSGRRSRKDLERGTLKTSVIRLDLHYYSKKKRKKKQQQQTVFMQHL
jgi:hypothetical protein